MRYEIAQRENKQRVNTNFRRLKSGLLIIF